MSFTIDREDKYIAVNLLEQGVHLWDFRLKTLLRMFPGVSQRNLTIYSSFSSPDASFLASGSEGKASQMAINYSLLTLTELKLDSNLINFLIFRWKCVHLPYKQRSTDSYTDWSHKVCELRLVESKVSRTFS